MKLFFLLFLASMFIFACGQNKDQVELKQAEKKSNSEQSQTQQSANIDKFTGSYADESYSKRAEGSDWVGVTVSKWSDSVLFIKVRSRTDKKKATCSFTGFAKLKGTDTFDGTYGSTGLQFKFSQDSLRIVSSNEESTYKLSYYCSGGGSLAGPYSKITGSLDRSQMDSLSYLQVLNYNDELFEVAATENDGSNMVIVRQLGAKGGNREYSSPYTGIITNAEIGDLNKDNFPEILVYVSSNDNARNGSVVGFSSNNGKSLSTTGVPSMKDDPSASVGYRGLDEFAIVEGTFVQRFPVYGEGSVPVKTRQIQYKLIDGEANRLFKIDKVIEY